MQMTDLTATQTRILSAGAQRSGVLAMPLPKGLHGAAAKKVVTMLLERGLVEEVDANIHKDAPLWRETGDGHGTTLVVTEPTLAEKHATIFRKRMEYRPRPQEFPV